MLLNDLADRKRRMLTHSREFRKCFNLDLARFVDHTGFDVSSFGDTIWEEWMESDGSLNNYIQEHYGKEAVDLINKIMSERL